MSKLYKQISRFMEDESGPTAVEYAVMLALIIGSAIFGVGLFGQAAGQMWDGNSTSISTAINN